MASKRASAQGGQLIAVIGDEDTVTGMLLAGVGHKNAAGQNYLVVTERTTRAAVEEAFRKFTKRADVAILLINQHVAHTIRHLLDGYDETIPTVLEIPSKDHPYDPKADTIMRRVNAMLGLSE
jgi:V-type H+-transporting ATPase subunit F